MSFSPLDINFLTDEMVQKAEDELGETPEKRQEALAQLRKAIEEEQKLTCPIDDKFLLMFLRGRKFNIQRAIENIKNFYKVQVQYADMLHVPKFEVFEKLFTAKAVNVLPYRDKDGCALLLFTLKNFDFEGMGMNIFVGMAAATELLLTVLYESTQICGLKLILDFTDVGMKHAKYISPRHIILMGKGMIYLMPIRYKAGYFVNCSLAAQCIWNILKPALSEKLKKRFQLIRKEDLTKFVDPALLPKEYGGRLDQNNVFWMNIIKNNETRIHQTLNGHYDF